MGAVFEAALAAGARGVALSGAGSGILALVVENSERVAAAMDEAGAACDMGGYSLQLAIQHTGIEVDRMSD
jgi:homoserine kinase